MCVCVDQIMEQKKNEKNDYACSNVYKYYCSEYYVLYIYNIREFTGATTHGDGMCCQPSLLFPWSQLFPLLFSNVGFSFVCHAPTTYTFNQNK